MPARRAWMTWRVMGSTAVMISQRAWHMGAEDRGWRIEDRNSPSSILDPPSSISTLRAKLRSFLFIDRIVGVDGVDGDTIDFARFFLCDIAVAHVVQDALGIAHERASQTAAAGRFETEN